LVRLAGLGDGEAFRKLVERYRGRIFRQALVQTGDPDDAEDVTQEVLVRLHLQLSGFRGDAKFETWLFTLTRNAAADQRRIRDRPQRIAARVRATAGRDLHVGDDPANRLDAAVTADRVRVFLLELSERQRTVIDLVDIQGYTTAEVASLLGMRPVTVRTHLLRARRKLRARLLGIEAEGADST